MVTADALLLRGQFLNALGRTPAALDTYEEGLAALAHLHRQLVRFRYRRSITYVQQRQMKEAWQEALLAQYEADHLQGLVQDEQGQFDEAYSYYQRALALAKSVKYEPGIAQTNRELAILLSRQVKLEEARKHAQEAIAYFERTGDRFGLETMNNVLTAIYFQAGQFEKSIEIAEIAMPFLKRPGCPIGRVQPALHWPRPILNSGTWIKRNRSPAKFYNIEEPQSYPYALFTLGRVQRARQNLEAAERYFQNSLDIAQENGDKFMEAYAWQALGKVYGDQGRSKASRSALTEALQQFEALAITQGNRGHAPLVGRRLRPIPLF